MKLLSLAEPGMNRSRIRAACSRQDPFRSGSATTLLALCLFLAACSNQENGAIGARAIQVGTELASEQVLNRHLGADPRSIDPSLATEVVGAMILDDIGEGLVTLSADGRTVPGVAASWETSADGKTWTFHLRDDARWSNGEAVTAEDFVYSWRRLVDPATGAEYAQYLAPVENGIETATGKMPPDRLGVEARGPRTLVVRLHTPTSYFLSMVGNMWLFPIYRPAVEQWGDSWTQPGHMISNGAFTLAERVNNGHITIVRNPHYWGASQVRLTKVVYTIISDSNSSTDQYLAGSLDVTDRIPPSRKDLLQKALGSQVVYAPYFGTAMFGYNFAKPPFAGNPKLCLALNIALDRDILAKYVMRETVLPAYNIMPPLAGYDPAVPTWANFSPDERHALARKLYREAGYSDSNPLEVVLTYATGGPETRRFMEAMSAMWQMNLGAKVQIYNMEWKVFLQARQLKQPTLYWNAWIGDYPDPFTFMQLFQTGFDMNQGSYSNPRFDALLERAGNLKDDAARYDLFHQAEAILNEDAPLLPVYYYQSAHLIKPYVKGWESSVTDRHLSRYLYVMSYQED